MSNSKIPEGATYILHGKFYMKFIENVGYFSHGKDWYLAYNGRKLEKWLTDYPDKIKELEK